jgi:predicted RNase H-like HicB family nuclease
MNDFSYLPLSHPREQTHLKVTVVLKADGQGWLASCPELAPHGASTWCTTREAALHAIHELIEDIAAQLRERGVPIPDEVLISITTP